MVFTVAPWSAGDYSSQFSVQEKNINEHINTKHRVFKM